MYRIGNGIDGHVCPEPVAAVTSYCRGVTHRWAILEAGVIVVSGVTRHLSRNFLQQQGLPTVVLGYFCRRWLPRHGFSWLCCQAVMPFRNKPRLDTTRDGAHPVLFRLVRWW